MTPELPDYDELPVVPGAPAGSSWGVFGEDDTVGTLNLLTDERVVSASRLVSSGKVFPLDLALDAIEPGMFGRRSPDHHIIDFGGGGFDDYLDSFYLQGTSQWDALRHIRHPADGFYNSVADDDAGLPGKLGIDTVAQRGIVGRGVLLDVERHQRDAGRPLDITSNSLIGPEMLDRCAAGQQVELRPGDLLLVRTGWLTWYRSVDQNERAKLADFSAIRSPGIGPPGEMARYLWDHHVAAVASDNVALEPPGAGELHFELIPHLGIPIGELWDLDQLAEDCAQDGRYEFLLTSAPLHLVGGVGSPPNALAIK